MADSLPTIDPTASRPSLGDRMPRSPESLVLRSVSRIAVLTSDLSGNVTAWSPGAERTFGWSETEAVGQPARTLISREDGRDILGAAEIDALLNVGHSAFEGWLLRKDGERIWVSVDTTPLVDDGLHVGYVSILRDRTEQGLAIERQRSDAVFMRNVLAASDDCIKVLDLDAKLVFMSEGGQRVMEVSDFNAIKGCPWPDFWQGAGNLSARQAVEAARAGGVGRFQGVANTMEGNARHWDVQVTPILGADGRPEKLLSVSRDVSATYEAENALREQLALNKLILDSSPDCITVLDLNGITLFMNASGIAALELHDIPTVLGRSWIDFWSDSGRALVESAMDAARTGKVGHFKDRLSTRTGQAKWWDVAISLLPGTDGAADRLVAVARDVTVRRTAEDLLAKSQERLSLALGAAGMIGIWDWDLTEDLIYADANFARIYEVDPESAARGAPLADYLRAVHPDDRSVFEEELQRVLAGAPEFVCEYRIVQKDAGSRWLLTRGRLVREKAETPLRLSGACVDITDRKLAEEQRNDLTRELAHRMKNTLAMVQAIVTQTFRTAATMEAGTEAITQRLAALGRAQDILTQTSWAEAGIHDVVEGALRPHRTGEGRIVIAGPAVSLSAQQSLGLALALHELATNAVKYGALSGESGIVSVAWSLAGGKAFTLEWTESGGPPVMPRLRPGFGSRLVERIVASYFEGTAKLHFEPAGLRFRLDGKVGAYGDGE